MSNIQQLIVLDLSEINKKITELAKTEIKSDNHKASLLIQIMVYEKIKQQSKPLEPIVSEQIILGQIEVLEEMLPSKNDCKYSLELSTVYDCVFKKIQELKAKLK